MPVSLLPALELLVIWSLETLSGEVLHKFPGYCYLICTQDSVEFESPTLKMAEHAAWSLSITVQSCYNGEEAGRRPATGDALKTELFSSILTLLLVTIACFLELQLKTRSRGAGCLETL